MNKHMTRLLQLEHLALWWGCAYAFTSTGYQWWWFWVWLLIPDLGMLGYLINTKVGAWTYNMAHHQALGVALIGLGWMAITPAISAAGWILLGHSFMDRIFGYGLKYPDHFGHTHLGWIGKNPPNPPAS